MLKYNCGRDARPFDMVEADGEIVEVVVVLTDIVSRINWNVSQPGIGYFSEVHGRVFVPYQSSYWAAIDFISRMA